MSNIYGVEVSNWAPTEVKEVECPFCHGVHTEFLRHADEARNVETHLCWDCKVDFEVEVEIPF